MNKIIRNFALLATLAIGATSCTTTELENITPQELDAPGAISLYASINSAQVTKIAFTDNASEGINLEWEIGDSFTLYNYPMYGATVTQPDTSKAGDFTCVSVDQDGIGKFTLSEGTTLPEDGYFYAVYPALDIDG